MAPAGGVAMSMLIAVLFGAIIFTWRAGLPSSSSHALIGALIGMGLAVYGLDAVQWGELYPVFIALVTSPVIGLLIAYVLTVMLLNLFHRVRPRHANGVFRKLQLFSSGFVAFSHGANDAQKTMALLEKDLGVCQVVSGPKPLNQPGVPIDKRILVAKDLAPRELRGSWHSLTTSSYPK